MPKVQYFMEIEKISKIGMGCYRMTLENKAHLHSLTYAIHHGINLIDTASNYGSGNSEKLIGEMFNEISRDKVFVISKAGYIQGDDLEKFSSILKDEETVKLIHNSYYSINPEFLERQVTASLKRLHTDYIDGYLIHNPEYYFRAKNKDLSNQSHQYEYLTAALLLMERLVQKGYIRYYGISSNTLFGQEIDLVKILEHDLPHLKLVQFPYNLIENEATNKNVNNKSLVDVCKAHGLKTFSNRPLNTTYDGKVLRLADYSNELSGIDFSNEDILFEKFMDMIREQLIRLGDHSEPEDFTVLKFFIDNRKTIANPEAVIRAVKAHLIPFMDQLNFETETPLKMVNELTDYWIGYSKKFNTERVLHLKALLKSNGTIKNNDNRDISVIACENYLNAGIDHVLIGMRKKEYVDDMLYLLQ